MRLQLRRMAVGRKRGKGSDGQGRTPSACFWLLPAPRAARGRTRSARRGPPPGSWRSWPQSAEAREGRRRAAVRGSGAAPRCVALVWNQSRKRVVKRWGTHRARGRDDADAPRSASERLGKLRQDGRQETPGGEAESERNKHWHRQREEDLCRWVTVDVLPEPQEEVPSR